MNTRKFDGKEFNFYSSHRDKKSAYNMISQLEDNGLSFLYRVTKSKGMYHLWIKKVPPKIHYPITDKHGNQAKCPKCKIPLEFYDGALGYEAIYCPRCGFFEDHETKGQDDSFIEERPPRPKDKKGYITKWDPERREWVYEIRVMELDRG